MFDYRHIKSGRSMQVKRMPLPWQMSQTLLKYVLIFKFVPEANSVLQKGKQSLEARWREALKGNQRRDQGDQRRG
jgi:hypothetical protein